MKTGLTLQEMATELQRREEAKRDFIADTRSLEVIPSGGKLKLAIPVNGGSAGAFDLSQHALRQIGSRVKLPAQYADRLIEAGHADLLAQNLNQLFQREPERRMVRTLDGHARAFLSDRYRPLDNFDLANAVLPVLMEQPELKVVSTQFTDSRFYIKAVFPRVQNEVKVGDPVQSGVVISNSEIGAGSLTVSPLVFRLVCLNGMISAYGGQKKYHVGRAADAGEEAFEVYRDETIAADDRAFWLKVQDTVRASTKPDHFERIVQKMREATEQRIEGRPVSVVEELGKVFTYTETQKDSVLEHLLRGGDFTQYGILNAVTRASQDQDDYETATQMERDGGRIIELPKSDWERIAKAA